MIARRQQQSLVEVVLCSGVPTQLAVTGALRLAGLHPLAADGSLSLAFVALLSLADTVLVVGLAVWLLRRRGESVSSVWLGSRRIGRETVAGFLLAPLLLVGLSLTLWFLRVAWPVLRSVPENPLEVLARSTQGFVVLLVVVVVAGGLREELQRGFLLHRFREDLGGGTLGLAITSLGFGAGHLLQGLDAVVATAGLGLCWGLMYLRRGSVVSAVVSHALVNATQIAAVYAGAVQS